MIPKLCHFIWTRGAKMSLLQVISVVSFHRYNPDWKIIIHLIKQTPDELPGNIWVPDYTGENFFNIVLSMEYVQIKEVDLIKEGIGTDKHSIQASDLLRFRLLYKQGGVYSDFDTIWLRGMDEWPNISCYGDPEDFETTVCFFDFVKGHHNESNIISEPGGNYIHGLIEAQNEIKPPYEDYQTFLSALMNEKYPTRESIPFPRVLAINYKTFYPYSVFDMEKLYYKDDIRPINDPKVMAVHWFNGQGLSKEYVNSRWGEKCSMTSILKQEDYI